MPVIYSTNGSEYQTGNWAETIIEGEDSITIELRVDPDDMGKVIGKQGRIAKAVRTVVKAASAKSSKPVFVEII